MESSSDSMRFAWSISQQMWGELFFRVQTFSELEEVFRSTDVTVNFRCLIAGKMLKTSPNESIMNFLMDSSIPKFIRQAVVKRIQPWPLTKAYEEKLHEYSQKRPYSPKELESLRLVTSCFEVPLLQLTDLASKQYCDEVISGLAKSCKISSYAEFYQAATCIHRPEKVIQQLSQHVPSITLDEFNEFRRW